MIHACIGADVAVMRFGNQHGVAANEASRFLKNNFNEARVFLLPLGDGLGLGRRRDGCQLNERALGLRDNFLRDDQNVAVFKVQPRFACGA